MPIFNVGEKAEYTYLPNNHRNISEFDPLKIEGKPYSGSEVTIMFIVSRRNPIKYQVKTLTGKLIIAHEQELDNMRRRLTSLKEQ